MTPQNEPRLYNADLALLNQLDAHPDKLRDVLEAAARACPDDARFQRLLAIAAGRAGPAEAAWLPFYRALRLDENNSTLLAHILDHAERSGWHALVRDLVQSMPPQLFTDKIWRQRQQRLAIAGFGKGLPLFTKPQEAFNPTLRPLLSKTFEERMPLQALSGWGYLDRIETIWVVGAHRFDEKPSFDRLLPRLRSIILFEPHPTTFRECERRHRTDPRVRVLPVALSDRIGEVDFHLSSNDGLSSSLLPFGEHTHYEPTTHMTGTARVKTMTWKGARAAFSLPCPQLLVIDTQGAEYAILSNVPEADRRRIGVIYTEASTRPIYSGARTLLQLDALLRPSFVRACYQPICNFKGVHGNAVFLNTKFLAGAQTKPPAPSRRAAPATPDPALPGRVLKHLQSTLLGDLRTALEVHRHAPNGDGLLYLWGAGAYGRQMLELLRLSGFHPAGFIDRASDKWGTETEGLKVYPPDFFWKSCQLARTGKGAKPYVVVTTTIREDLFREFSLRKVEPTSDFYIPSI